MNNNSKQSQSLSTPSYMRTTGARSGAVCAGGACVEGAVAPLGNTTKLRDTNSVISGQESFKNQPLSGDFTPEKNGIFWGESSLEDFIPETGEVVTYEYNDKRKMYAKAYEEDVNLFQRWFLLNSARKVLSAKSMIEDRAKVYNSPYTDLTHKVKYTNLETGKEESYLSHEAGMPVVRNKRNKAEKRISTAPTFRVINCYRQKLPGKDVELYKHADTGRVNFQNVGVCGSTWLCPVCSAKINVARRKQIKEAYELVDRVGGAAYMFTFTIKHGYGDSLDDLTSKFKAAFEIFRKSYAFKSVTRSEPLKRPRKGSLPFLSHLGRISTLEVTHGNKNGWHPHEHQLWFFERELTKSELKRVHDDLFTEWHSACVAVGLPAPLKWVNYKGKKQYLALDIRKAMTADEYLTKFGTLKTWGVENELASSHVKKAKQSGRTPFQLLEDASFGDEKAGRKFIEFAYAFKGRHQIQFSRKLKNFIKEISGNVIDDSVEGDEALAAANQEEAQLLMSLTMEQFEIIVDQSLHAQVLIAAKHHGIAGVHNLLSQYDHIKTGGT